jgi:acetate kinase
MTQEPVWTFNAGSSSIKCAVFRGEQECCAAQVEAIGSSARLQIKGHDPIPLDRGVKHQQALHALIQGLNEKGFDLKQAKAVGHRLVHGGTFFQKPLVIASKQLAELQKLRNLAPLHNGYGLDIIEELLLSFPDIAQIACFDTAFHSTMSEVASRFPIPDQYFEKGYRRYGFHGINYEYLSEELKTHNAPSRVLAFHLGNGCSMAAIENGLSKATTMGYSTLDGLMMGTRTGNIDPGLIIALLRDEGLTIEQLENLLYRQSGLLGMSGMSNDMRDLLSSNEPKAQMAVEYFVTQAARQACSLIPYLGDADALVFSGGIGAGSSIVRERIIEKLAFLGFNVDKSANDARALRIDDIKSSKPIYVIAANEEKMLARHVMRMI